MPIYEHQCTKCEHIWEDLFKISDPVPEQCPECKTTGNIKRLISWCSGTVELSGHELKQHLKNEGKKLARKAQRDENLLANVVGETKYNDNLLKKND